MPTHYKGTDRERLALDTFIKLTRASDSLDSRLAQRGTQAPLTPSQFGVLETLYHLGTMCQYELGAKILRSSGNMTLVIDNLEKQGLVRRQRDSLDRRMIKVSLTEGGHNLIEKILPGFVDSIVEEFNVLTPEEQETLGRLCRKFGVRQDH